MSVSDYSKACAVKILKALSTAGEEGLSESGLVERAGLMHFTSHGNSWRRVDRSTYKGALSYLSDHLLIDNKDGLIALSDNGKNAVEIISRQETELNEMLQRHVAEFRDMKLHDLPALHSVLFASENTHPAQTQRRY